MAAYLSALLVAFLVHGLLACVLFGWGSILTRLLHISLPKMQLIVSQLWLGWAVVLLLTQLLNFVMPINWIATLIITLGGLVVGWINRRVFPPIRIRLRSENRQTLLFAVAVLLTTVWLCTQSMRVISTYDTGLYHLQSIRWYNEYAIVPGLGNLHGRLAFNQSSFAFAALLNFYPFFKDGHTLANGFIYLLLAVEGWHALFLQRGDRSMAKSFAIFMLPFLAGLSLRESPNSVAPDTTTAILLLVIWLQLVRLLEEALPSQHAKSRIYVILILSATALTVKMSSLGFIIGVGLIILVHDARTRPSPLPQRIAYLLNFLWIPLLLLLVWVVRGYFLSGYPLFPLTTGAIDVDWRVPFSAAENEANAIYLWTRHLLVDSPTDAKSPISVWFWVWLKGLSRLWAIYPVVVMLLLAAMYGVVKFWLRATKRSQISRQVTTPDAPHKGLSLVVVVAFPVLLGLLFWWLTAPDPRFVRSLFALLPMLMAYVFLRALEQAQLGKPHWNQITVLLLINLVIASAFVTDATKLLQLPASFSPIPTSKIVTETLPTGLQIFMPTEDERCWNAELPCTPYLNSELQLRGSDLQQGFIVVTSP